ncbi:hypothetical protein [Methanobrevibacter olleyae]|uniref:Uncharacterized protein n=1 Tax=Methanobrevibacter olleyae TaxID=294671 RepID=A0A126QYX7_METOL|nr:hypothetical protein [Methanobrevibacter olleyae]AMK14982.1 hypothetical protein YLM1_0425 [Methanobrevibacter olleyae]
MADSLDLFTGVLLTVIGLVLIYGSIVYRLIDLILVIGILITLFGLYKLLPAFILRILDSRNFNRSSRSRNRLNQNSRNDAYSRVKEGAKGVENFLNSSKGDNGSFFKSHDDELDSSTATLDDFIGDGKSREDELKFDMAIDENKQVLRPKPVKEEKPKFKIPSIRKSNGSKKRNFAYLKEDQEEPSPDTLYFTPNYEKPMKITRRPKRKSKNTISLVDAPKRSEEISKALASVGNAETVYDNEVTDESYSLIPKTIDEEIIMPIDEIDLDDSIEEPFYNLSQSENTLYNNVIYDGPGEEDFITPIHADTDYKQDISDDHLEEYGDFSSDELLDDENGFDQEITDDSEFISPEHDIDVENLARPTSIASTNPIASKNDANLNLSKPHRKSETLSPPKPRAKINKETTGSGTNLEREIPSPIQKTPESDVSDIVADVPISELVDAPDETIRIDPNNPESLPIPKLLNSYVICEKGILTSQEAFEEVASHSKEEILLEAPTIKDMGERFLSSISKIKSRVLIEEFDLEDISYVLLLSSLIKKGVEIKTLDSVESFNLIGDSSHALLISNSIDEDDFEYGAVYEDKDSVENIKELFESSWILANDLDINTILENN